MPQFNRLFKRYQATYDASSFARRFPELQQWLRDAYPPESGYTVRAAKGKKQWTLYAYRGVPSGFRIDFLPAQAAFEPPRVEVRVAMYSRLVRLAISVAVGLFFCLAGILYGVNLIGAGGLPGWVVAVIPAAVGILAAILGGSAAGFCASIRGRPTKEKLTAIGEADRPSHRERRGEPDGCRGRWPKLQLRRSWPQAVPPPPSSQRTKPSLCTRSMTDRILNVRPHTP